MNSTRWILVMLALQVVILLGQWVGQPALPAAQAQIPDAGAQRNEIIDEIKITNDKLDRLISLFENGDAYVKVLNLPPPPTSTPKTH